MSDKNVLIFDESTSNLDEKNSRLFWDELRNLKKTIIVVSHDCPLKERDIFDEEIMLNDYCQSKQASA